MHLIFPHNCIGCGTDVIENNILLCAKCYQELPLANIFDKPDNHIEKLFYGRLNIEFAGSAFHYTKDSLMQKLLKQLKYRGNELAGEYLGQITGSFLQKANRFNNIDLIVPVPLSDKRLYQRGYNQALVLAKAMGKVLDKPVVNNAVQRLSFSESQTELGRISRWQNMEGRFKIAQPHLLQNKHVLLVDDVVTTGATLEACGMEILEVAGCKLSLATVACAT
jgi:ComF family protein